MAQSEGDLQESSLLDDCARLLEDLLPLLALELLLYAFSLEPAYEREVYQRYGRGWPKRANENQREREAERADFFFRLRREHD
mmetsp:Transcript_6801/g.11452  ORF Transcript_6801/g.11452 Transcript_6801/m.11452 type:complete len:83 (-) Transcript_6801:75-323(-)